MLGQISTPPPPPWLDPTVFLSSLVWSLLRTLVTFFICFVLGIASLGILDKLTPGVREIYNVRSSPLSTALFALGVFVFLTFSILASVIAPLPIGISSGLGETVNPLLLLAYRLTALLAGFVLSLVFAALYYRLLAKIKPFGISLDSINKEPIATGVYVLGFLLFLGAVVYVALVIPA